MVLHSIWGVGERKVWKLPHRLLIYRRMDAVTLLRYRLLGEHQGGNGERVNLSLRLLRLVYFKVQESGEQFYLIYKIDGLGNIS